VTRRDFVVADDQDNVIARTHTIVHENVVNVVDVWTHPATDAKATRATC